MNIASLLALVVSLSVFIPSRLSAEERTERFNEDPGWEGHNHRVLTAKPRIIKQDFGYSRTHHAGGKSPGELGGFINPAGEPAYYAKKISTRTLDGPLTASGTLACTGSQFHVLVGFFNANTINEWRTPNTIALRLYGRGDVFYAYVEYTTKRWRAGGDSPRPFTRIRDPRTGRERIQGFASRGTVHRWSLKYDPQGNRGNGSITVTLGDEVSVCNLAPGHKADGAEFNRFGMLNVVKSFDDGGELWLDDIAINGQKEFFDKDPGWEQFQNRRIYTSNNIRPRFNFGYSKTHFARGISKGELGGLVFRGDIRYPDRMAYYGDRLNSLTLDKPLKASGNVSLRRGVSDSTTLIGFFHSKESMAETESQKHAVPKSFLGIAVEGPSREGFYFYPLYRVNGDGAGIAGGNDRPRILPDGAVHEWTLDYAPGTGNGRSTITISLDGKRNSIELNQQHKSLDTRFNRFGIVTTWIDGNGQRIYFDDLTYTCKQN